MAKMTKAQVLAIAKENVMDIFKDILESVNAEQVGDFSFAIPTTVNDTERWVKVSLTAKDTMTNESGDKVAYDPFVEQSMWEEDKADKAERKAERERKHEETLRRAEERKAKAKAKAEAKRKAKESE